MGSMAPLNGEMQVTNTFRQRILSGEVCAALSTKITTRNELPMFCKMANIHALFIDMEHTSFDVGTVAQLCAACNFVGVSPIVRIPSKSHWQLSRAFDYGAAAVVIPHVDTVEEVKQLVQAGKYAPIGKRGCTNNQPLMNYQHVPTKVQNEVLNREQMLIPMIETPEAVDLVDEYLAIDGVDGILIGSNDLCSDMGIHGQYDNPLYQDAVTKIVQAGKRAGKPIGIGGIGGRLDLLEMWFKMGATWSLSGADIAILQAGMKKIGENYSGINERLRADTKNH